MSRKRLMTLFSLIVAASVYGSPVNSILGADGAEWCGEGMEYPYVTDGLIAAWDGEWNVGVGVHDANAGWWTDIAGGRGIPVTSVNVGWGSDCLRRFGDWMISATDAPIISEDFSEGWTVEVVVSLEGVETVLQSRPFLSFGDFRIRVPNITSNAVAQVWVSNIGGWGVATCPFGRASFALTRCDYEYSVFVNGGLLRVATDKRQNDHNPTNILISQNLLRDSEGVQSTSDLCAIRIYNRPLSATEVNYNYLIDKERFGLE